MIDTTEPLRCKLVAEINSRASDPVSDRARLEAEYGPGNVWDTNELRRDFNVVGFAAPFVSVVRRADGKHGSLEFQHSPRLYFDFKED